MVSMKSKMFLKYVETEQCISTDSSIFSCVNRDHTLELEDIFIHHQIDL